MLAGVPDIEAVIPEIVEKLEDEDEIIVAFHGVLAAYDRKEDKVVYVNPEAIWQEKMKSRRLLRLFCWQICPYRDAPGTFLVGDPDVDWPDGVCDCPFPFWWLCMLLLSCMYPGCIMRGTYP